MRKAIRIKALATAGAVTAMLGGMASAAQAVTHHNVTGAPGAASFFKAAGATVPFATHTLALPGPVVGRSGASRYRQTVEVTRIVLKRIPSNPMEGLNPWKVETRDDLRAYVGSRSIRFRDFVFSAQSYVSYRVVYRMTWFHSDGRRLGQRWTSYNKTADYQCLTANCAVPTANDGYPLITFTY